MNYEIQDVSISEIEGFFFERSIYNDEDIKELSENMQESGSINEISFRTLDNGKLQGLAGSRRYKANILSGIESFKAKVYSNVSDIDALNICLSENIHTKEMSSIDVSKLLKQWIDSGSKQTDIAKKLGKSKAWVSKQLKLLDIDEGTQKAIAKGQITAEHARVIDILPNKKDREALLKSATDNGLSVSEIKKQTDKKISRINIVDKIDKINSVIIDYEQKIIDADNATNQISTHEMRLSELDIMRKNINGSLADEGIKQKAFSIEIIYEKIRPLETQILSVESEIQTMNTDRQNIDIEKTRQEHTKQAKKVKTAESKVEKLQNELNTAKEGHKSALSALKPLQNTLNEYTKLTKTITDKTQTLNNKKNTLTDLIKVNKETYDNYDDIVKEVTEYSETAKEIEKITTEYADISALIPKLRGTAANKTRYEDIMLRNKAELEKLEILAA